MEKESIYLVEITVDHKPSMLDDMIRGRPHTGQFHGSITQREAVNETYLAIGQSRDQAIDYFRRVIGSGHRLESVQEARSWTSVRDVLDKILRGSLRSSIRYPDEEKERLENLTKAMRESRR